MNWTVSHRVAAHAGVSRETLAAWARKGWISRSRVGSAVYYDIREIEALIDANAQRPTTSNVTPISEELAESDAYFGIDTATATASRSKKKRAGRG